MSDEPPSTGSPIADPGQLLLAGDWHGDADWARHVIDQAPAGCNGSRLIVQLGDFGVWPGRSGVRYLDRVAAALEACDATCLFLDGNHEDFPQLAALRVRPDGLRELRPRLFHLPRGTRWTWRGLRFLALGGATSLDRPWRTPNIDWWPAEELTDDDVDGAIRGGGCEVLLTHDAPSGIDVPGIPPPSAWEAEEVERADQHRRRLRQVVDAVRPTWLFHGHFHSRYGATLQIVDGHRVQVSGLSNDWSGSDGFLVLDLERMRAEPLGHG
jgi:hypothetical protein